MLFSHVYFCELQMSHHFQIWMSTDFSPLTFATHFRKSHLYIILCAQAMTSWQGMSMLPYFLAAKKARENPRLNSFHQQI
jgi:hypothetical protein